MIVAGFVIGWADLMPKEVDGGMIEEARLAAGDFH